MRGEDLLRDSGLRATSIRVRVLEAVVDASGALAQAEILDRVQEQGDADRVSVYRALDALVERHLVVRTSGPDRSYRYCSGDAGACAHSHFYCSRCGAMRCLPPGAFTLDSDLLPEDSVVDRIEMRVEGLCGDCRMKKTHE
ncbi:Fur family transcriptional regulator [Desulfovibrio ferrophilus]|uniref:Ferric uptake regulator family protein n=1 Tax=Desulfovibrio ferrophilus TaxID=241368 RepID=A0A2Z6AZL6_9BACT|nr:transcriptional repressor [Desulfovibrio ferrophilus]BBD08692.1 ferric uptake regulator family protein [Desulfovibrio ferrophilus]